MATYKVIQDIEAEDHILGPLTLRQFIFLIIAVFLFWINFLIARAGAAFLMIVTLPPALFFGFFALPFGRDQPTEVWALAKLRYWFKPRKRIWNQDGVKDMVTITVPKKIERVLTNGLSETEVKSRLTALANTIDSRGWAVKNVGVNYTSQLAASSSDRLIDVNSLPQPVPDTTVTAADDILDHTNNPIAQQFDTMIGQASQAHRQHIIDEMNAVQPGQDLSQQTAAQQAWFMDNQQAQIAAAQSQVIQASQPAMTVPADPAILDLANNDDLTVSTIAREAQKARGGDDLQNGEVVISLR